MPAQSSCHTARTVASNESTARQLIFHRASCFYSRTRNETIARLPGGVSEQIAIKGSNASQFQAGWPQGIAPLGLPRIRTCPLGHTAPHIMNSLRDGSLSESGSPSRTRRRDRCCFVSTVISFWGLSLYLFVSLWGHYSLGRVDLGGCPPRSPQIRTCGTRTRPRHTSSTHLPSAYNRVWATTPVRRWYQVHLRRNQQEVIMRRSRTTTVPPADRAARPLNPHSFGSA